MQYKILDNNTAVVLTRQPEIVYDELYITFSGAPLDSTAIVETSGDSLYRKLCEGTCAVPATKLRGEIKITVAILDGTTPPKRWACEELKAEVLKDGGTLVSPNDMNLPQRFVELKLENEGIRQSQERLEGRVKELEDRLEKLLEGYDLT